MGKKVDFFVLTAGITAALYIYFRGAFENRLLSIALAMLCCVLLQRLLRSVQRFITGSAFMKRRRLRRQADSALMLLACLPKQEAVDRLSTLLGKVYGSGYAIELIQAHPASTINENAIFDLWKQHRGCGRLVVCSSCQSSPAARDVAAALQGPAVALLDAGTLAQLIAEHPEGMFPPEEKEQRRRLRLHRLRDLFFCRKNVPKCLMMFLSMLLIYLLTGNRMYLICALSLLLAALLSLRSVPRPAKLF